MKELLYKSELSQPEYFKDIVTTIRQPLLVLDADLRVSQPTAVSINSSR